MGEMEETGGWSMAKTFVRSGRFKLFASYALYSWECVELLKTDNSWLFTAGLALYSLGGNLQLPAIGNLANSLAVISFGVLIGRWIDNASRLTAGRWSLTVNQLSIVVSGSCWILVLWEAVGAEGWVRWALTVGGLGAYVLSALGAEATRIALARDWPVVLAAGSQEALAALNATLVTIDQVAGVLSPLLLGLLIAEAREVAALVGVGCLALVLLPVHWVLLAAACRASPDLAKQEQAAPTPTKLPPIAIQESDVLEDAQTSTQLLPPPTHIQNVEAIEESDEEGKRCGYFYGWLSYFRQLVFPAAFALALLYFTVLGLDGITSSYIVSQGLRADSAGVAQALGSVSGILGSLAFPFLRQRLGLPRTGLFALVWELSCLGLPLASVFLPGSPAHWLQTTQPSSNASLVMESGRLDGIGLGESGSGGVGESHLSIWFFVVGIVLSRFGLWMGDLSVVQIMQEGVREEERGAIFGVQSSAQQIFSVMKDVLVIAFPDPRNFGYLVIVSFTAIAAALCSFVVYFVKSTSSKPLPQSSKTLLK